MESEQQFIVVCTIPREGEIVSRFHFYINAVNGDYPVVVFDPIAAEPMTKTKAQWIVTRLTHPSGNCYIPRELLEVVSIP